MATNLTLIFSTLLLTSILLHIPTMTKSDDTCPYPCLPPPTGTGTGTPTVTTPTPPATQTGSYPPPAGVFYPPPAGNSYPYNPPTGNNYGYGPPPPDPILPYFPYYYRKPPHQTDVSSAISLQKSRFLITIAVVLAFITFLHL